jgi:structural maintenance of chromosome 4
MSYPQTPHEEGLLEYLEDIIGSNAYVEQIGESSKVVEALTEQRAEKLNRVKLVEREKAGLEGSKGEAEALLSE